MKKLQWALATSTFFLSLTAAAQNEAVHKTPPAYGDNPNLLKVLTVKAQEKVQSAAEKVGAVAEKGVAKIKPGVDETWQNTKEYTSEQAVNARDHARQGIDNAVQKVKETKNNVFGSNQGNIPIERGTLSQPSTPPLSSIPSQSSTPSQVVTAPAAIQPNEPIQTIETNQTPQTITPPASSELNDSQNAQTEFHPSEIQRQSLPIQSSSAEAPVNVETPNTAP